MRGETPIRDIAIQLHDYIKGQQMAMTEQVFGNTGPSRESHNITARGLRFVFEKARLTSLGRAVKPKEF